MNNDKIIETIYFELTKNINDLDQAFVNITQHEITPEQITNVILSDFDSFIGIRLNDNEAEKFFKLRNFAKFMQQANEQKRIDFDWKEFLKL